MAKYRKKPVVIDAVQFTREMAEGSEPLPDGVQFRRRGLNSKGRFHDFEAETNFRFCHRHVIDTLEGEMDVQVGAYVIRGVAGEFYPCNLDIFAATYEAVEDPTREPLAAASGEPVADWNTAIEAAAQACENRARSYTDLNDTSLRNEALKCASAIRMRTRADAAPVAPVVELDEWAIVDKNNVPARFRDNTDEASISRQDLDTLNPQFAPHRVMRVCLKEVDRG